MHILIILCVVVFAMLFAGFKVSGTRNPLSWAVLTYGGLVILLLTQAMTHFLGGS